MKTGLVWITNDAEELLVHIARVSNPKCQEAGKDPARLIKYLIDHRHWSPFEMVSACVQIETTRDIGRQILRHRSFSFQEFSQRYADVGGLEKVEPRECRRQDAKNRQSSTPVDDNTGLAEWWTSTQLDIARVTEAAYHNALGMGVAKEVARAVLTEGLTPSRMYMAGTLRSWLHYLEARLDPGTQLEHRHIAEEIRALLAEHVPSVFAAMVQ
jgi:thymidylate synthase (FAD)